MHAYISTGFLPCVLRAQGKRLRLPNTALGEARLWASRALLFWTGKKVLRFLQSSSFTGTLDIPMHLDTEGSWDPGLDHTFCILDSS